jgi:hypothetical protein
MLSAITTSNLYLLLEFSRSFCRQQMSQLMLRCADLLSSLYAPIPEDSEDEDAGDTPTYSLNSTSEMERGNRHVRENTFLLFHLARLKIFLPLHNLLHFGYGDMALQVGGVSDETVK